MQNLGCYAVSNLELSVNLPAVASGDRVFATVVDAFSHNVSITCMRLYSLTVIHMHLCVHVVVGVEGFFCLFVVFRCELQYS